MPPDRMREGGGDRGDRDGRVGEGNRTKWIPGL
jgi:hypothetical protein